LVIVRQLLGTEVPWDFFISSLIFPLSDEREKGRERKERKKAINSIACLATTAFSLQTAAGEDLLLFRSSPSARSLFYVWPPTSGPNVAHDVAHDVAATASGGGSLSACGSPMVSIRRSVKSVPTSATPTPAKKGVFRRLGSPFFNRALSQQQEKNCESS
jgi:hypothetical protein